jgi:hypothetical protein
VETKNGYEDRTWLWKASSLLEPKTKNIMKTSTVPGSSMDHTQTSNSLNSGSGWQKKLIGSLGVLLLLAFAMLSTREAKSDDNRARDKDLAGTWNVTLRFPDCTATCPCPGGVPNIPIASLNTYQKDGTLLVGLGSLFAGAGHGSWERIGNNHFTARFKFFLFNAAGVRTGSEEVTKDIRLTGPDTFEATSTFDLFDVAGNMTSQGCIINETATRFE